MVKCYCLAKTYRPVVGEDYVVVTWDYHMAIEWLPLGYHVVSYGPVIYHAVIKWLSLGITVWLSYGCQC